MNCDPDRLSQVPIEDRLNVFALVTYIPGPLGKFLDDLRLELAPTCKPHAHVSLLPPRPLAVTWHKAADYVREVAGEWQPFDVELTGIKVFDATDVIHFEIGAGSAELHRLHAAVNSGPLAFDEPFPFHPHITIAQEIPHEEVERFCATAAEWWKDYRGDRWFRADRAVFVQNTLGNHWIDLAECFLGAVHAKL